MYTNTYTYIYIYVLIYTIFICLYNISVYTYYKNYLSNCYYINFILLEVSSDEAHIGGYGNPYKCTPLLVYIANARYSAFKAIFLGYIPTKNLYSLPQRHKILERMGYLYIKHRETIIKMEDRKDYLSYIYNALEPMLRSQTHGFLAQVGNDDNATSYTFSPYLISHLGDTPEMDYISGVGSGGKYMKCRVCTQTNCAKFARFDFPDAPGFRDLHQHETLAVDLQEAELSHINACRDARKLRQQSISLKRMRHQAQIHSLTAGFNDLFHLPPELYDEDRSLLLSFHSMFVPDDLHTFLKGLVENNIGWTMMLVFNFGKLDETYSNSLSILERLVADMSSHEALAVCPDINFKNLSDMLKASSTKSQKKKPNMSILRTIAASKFPSS